MHYQLCENASHRILLGTTDLKMRHMRQLGWTIIEVPFSEFSVLNSQESRQKYLSLMLEIATNRVNQIHMTKEAKRKSP